MHKIMKTILWRSDDAQTYTAISICVRFLKTAHLLKMKLVIYCMGYLHFPNKYSYKILDNLPFTMGPYI